MIPSNRDIFPQKYFPTSRISYRLKPRWRFSFLCTNKTLCACDQQMATKSCVFCFHGPLHAKVTSTIHFQSFMYKMCKTIAQRLIYYITCIRWTCFLSDFLCGAFFLDPMSPQALLKWINVWLSLISDTFWHINHTGLLHIWICQPFDIVWFFFFQSPSPMHQSDLSMNLLSL